MLEDIPHQAFVLHSRDYTDSRILVDLLTDSVGRVSAAYRISSRNRAKPQLFTPFEVNFKGKSSLKTLLQIEVAGAALLRTGKPLYCGLYLNELLQHVLAQEDAYPDTFCAYHTCLLALSTASPGEEDIPLRQFELSLLHELGYGIDFQMDVYGNPILANSEMRYGFDPGEGFIPATDDIRGEIITAAALAQIASQSWQSLETRRAAKYICRTALNKRLGGKALVSRELFKA